MSTTETKVTINHTVKPTYADFIIEVKVNNKSGLTKLLLAQEYDGNIVHTDTIVLPMHSLVLLKELVNSDEFNAALEQSNVNPSNIPQ